MKPIKTVIALLTILSSTITLASPLLDIRNGKLWGASRVMVDEISYDVQFADGSCNSLFAACNTSLFAFNTYDQSRAAALALSSQVLIDSIAGSFDTDASLTNGCTDPAYCSIWIPYIFFLKGTQTPGFVVSMPLAENMLVLMEFRNEKNELSDYIASYGYLMPGGIETLNTSDAPHFVFTKWSITPTRVTAPEPTPLILLATGLALSMVRVTSKYRKARQL